MLRYIVLLFAFVLTACGSVPVATDNGISMCEDAYLSRGDFVMDLRTAEIGVVEVPCHSVSTDKVVSVILENREGTALLKRNVPRKFVAIVTMKTEGS